MEGLPSHDQEQVDFVNEAELLLLRARRIAQRIQDRLWKVMHEHEANGPHLTTSCDSPPPAEAEPERDDERQESSRQPQERGSK